jgi:nucleotide-binding universal stress UspA family protein
MYKRILVAVDGSDMSNSALHEAIKLAKDLHSILRLFHVVDLTMAYSTVEAPYVLDYRKAMEAGGQKVLADCAAFVRASGVEFESKCEIVFGTYVYEAIEEEATGDGLGRRPRCSRNARTQGRSPLVAGKRRGGLDANFK